MLIRPMEADDVDSVHRIECDSFSMPWSRQGFLDALKMEQNILLVAEEDGVIYGYACTYVSFDEGELTNIAVDKNMRGNGIGQLMIKKMQEIAGQTGVDRIVLEARVSNQAAIGLYKKMGFAELGIRKNFYEQPVEDAMILSYTAEAREC